MIPAFSRVSIIDAIDSFIWLDINLFNVSLSRLISKYISLSFSSFKRTSFSSRLIFVSSFDESSITLSAAKKLRPVKIKTGPWPSFATDNMPILLPVLTKVPGKCQIEETIFKIFKKYSSSESIPILPLFSVSTNPPTLNELKNITLLIPCLDTKVPDQQLLLPNAPRAYRNGTHRGIDFYVNWGSSVRAVADGVIIRADHNYQEMSADFRLDLLNDTKVLGRTPSDVFEHLLLNSLQRSVQRL